VRKDPRSANEGGGYTEIFESDCEVLDRHLPAAIGESDPPNQPVTLLVATSHER
jgi:hypothetical protein